MNKIKKVIALHVATLLAFASMGIAHVHASEVTGSLSSSSASSGSTAGGTVGGSTSGGSTVTGTASGGSGGGSTVTGTVSSGGGGGGGSSIIGTVGGGGGGSQSPAQPQGQVLGASTAVLTPGLPSAGVGPSSVSMTTLAILALLLVAGYMKIRSVA